LRKGAVTEGDWGIPYNVSVIEERIPPPSFPYGNATSSSEEVNTKIFQLCIYKMHKENAKFSFKMSKREN
jgi:hypothetical protein